MRDNYLKFLTLGCTLNPIDSLKVSGIDMTSDTVINDATKYMEELLNEINKLGE